MSDRSLHTLPGIIDSHAHVHAGDLAADLAGVLERAKAAGVSAIVTIGTTLVDSEMARDVAAANPMIFATAGIHPHDVGAHSAADLGEIRELAADPPCVAVGEIGLDYHYDHSPRDVQREFFRAQMQIAQEMGRPVVIHSREAEADTLGILREFPDVTGVLHCFSSAYPLAAAGLELGYYVSFSGIVTFKAAEEVRDAARKVPLERMLVETDCPFLAPVPFRGRQNEPAYVTLVAAKLAEIKGVSPEALVKATADNARTLFGLT